MVTGTTNGVKISVETAYQPFHSNPALAKYIFSYTVRITNLRNYDIQLLSRQWHIFDSNRQTHLVQGEGVIGKQPIISPGDTYEYSSYCPLTTEMGKMGGFFNMLDMSNEGYFEAFIPDFQLLAAFKQN